jgi:hypothetical protein
VKVKFIKLSIHRDVFSTEGLKFSLHWTAFLYCCCCIGTNDLMVSEQEFGMDGTAVFHGAGMKEKCLSLIS